MGTLLVVAAMIYGSCLFARSNAPVHFSITIGIKFKKTKTNKRKINCQQSFLCIKTIWLGIEVLYQVSYGEKGREREAADAAAAATLVPSLASLPTVTYGMKGLKIIKSSLSLQ